MIFEQIKNAVPIKDAAQRYGMDINRYDKALCPFHPDKHPSLSFKDGFFKCFACGEGGDVIKLVQRLQGYTHPIEAAKELNNAYGLGWAFKDRKAPKPPETPYGISIREHATIKRALRGLMYEEIR